MTSVEARTSVAPGNVDLRCLWRHRKTLFTVAILSGIAGGIYCAFAPRTYEATSRLHIELPERPLGAATGMELRGDRNFIPTQAEVLGSFLLIAAAVEKLPGGPAMARDPEEIARFSKALTVSQVVDTNVLSIRFTSEDPEEAVSFVEALIGSYQADLQETESSQTDDLVRLLTEREADLRSELRDLHDRFVRERKASPLVGQGTSQVETQLTILSEMARTLADVRLRTVQLNSRRAALAEASDRLELPAHPEDDLASLALVARLRDLVGDGSEDLAAMETQLRTEQVARQQVRQQYGPLHPQVQQANVGLERWWEFLRERTQTTLEFLDQQLKIEATAQGDLEELYENVQQQAKALDDLLIQERALLADIERTEQAYAVVFSRLKELILSDEALSRGKASIAVRDLVGSARQAELIWPHPPLLIGACILVGLMFAAFFVLATESLHEFRATSPPTPSPE